MKNKAVLFLVLMMCAGAVNVNAASDKRYTFKSGIIEYKVSGMQNGTSTLYFDDFGRREGRHRTAASKFMGISQSIDEATYFDGEWAYHYDKKAKTATKMNYKEFIEDMQGNKSLKDFGEDMLKGMGGTKTGTKTIAGKSCDVWEVPSYNTTACIYKNSVPLETIAKVMGMEFYEVATSIKENVSIPRDMLELPQGVPVRDMGNMAEYLEQAQPDTDMQAADMDAMGNIFKMFGQAADQKQEAVQKAMVREEDQSLSERELDLKEKELELKRMELELEKRKMQAATRQQAPQEANESAMDQVKDTINTTNKVTNTVSGLRSLFGR